MQVQFDTITQEQPPDWAVQWSSFLPTQLPLTKDPPPVFQIRAQLQITINHGPHRSAHVDHFGHQKQHGLKLAIIAKVAAREDQIADRRITIVKIQRRGFGEFGHNAQISMRMGCEMALISGWRPLTISSTSARRAS